jgi:4-aminobutyrate aminotransferase-like enzyme
VGKLVHAQVNLQLPSHRLELTRSVQVNIGFSERYLELINALLPVMPHPSLDCFFFWNSGAEAVEAAIKLARMATKKQNIIVVQGSYHGRTFGTMAMTKVSILIVLGGTETDLEWGCRVRLSMDKDSVPSWFVLFSSSSQRAILTGR